MNRNLVQVQMLGELCVSCGSVNTEGGRNRSSKARSLLCYLLYNRSRMISIDELIRILESDKRESDPVHALQAMLYRIRCSLRPIEHEMGMPLILTKNGRYGWNPEAPIDLDVVRFETMCQEEIPTGPDRTEHCRQLIALYGGDFLGDLVSEQWVEPPREYYRNLFLSAVERCVPILIEDGLAKEAAEACRAGIHLSPYSESLYACLMQACAAMGDSAGAASVYEELRSLLYKDLGVLPGEEIRQTYQEIMLSSGNSILSPDTIREQLQEFNPNSGAFICDFTSFKLIYRAEARAAMRRGDAIHIGILSVRARGSRTLTAPCLKRAMDHLNAQIQGNLRTGDIAACCSASQYVLLLLQANYENSRQVCDRVIQAYYSAYPRSPVRIHTDVFPLQPTFDSQGGPEKRTW